jgi:azurin
MPRSYWTVLALLGAVAVIVQLVVQSRAPGSRQAGVMATTNGGWPPQSLRQYAGPADQTYAYPAPSGFVPPGPLQRGVDPAKITRMLSVSSRPDTPVFEPTKLTAYTDDVIYLDYTNRSPESLHYRHNWVLVRPGAAAGVGNAGARAGEIQGWIPASTDVLAHSRLVQPGGTDTVIFKAPSEEGDYPYVCTFPGHYQSEAGVIHIRKRGP